MTVPPRCERSEPRRATAHTLTRPGPFILRGSHASHVAAYSHLRMTGRELLHRRDRDHDGADIVAAIDDLTLLVRPDDAGVERLKHLLLAVHDHGQFARQHDIDLLRRRGVRPGAAAR